MRFRKATEFDLFTIVQIAYKCDRYRKDILINDNRKLASAIESPNSHWYITEVEGTAKAVISMMLNKDHGLCKITHMIVDPGVTSQRELLRLSLAYVIDDISENEPDIDVIYTTTTSLSIQEQEVTLEEGFKIFGVFPNLLGQDNSQLNGLTAYFLRDALIESRVSQFSTHPKIQPFFRIASEQCRIPFPKILTEDELSSLMQKMEPIQIDDNLTLEMIRAPRFVKKRFQNHLETLSQVTNFYPFYVPNTLITDPDLETEVFIRMNRKARFAAIICENLTKTVNPTALYVKVQELLKAAGISYIEIINDASDVYGIDCILKAGFTPSAYFPAFKRQGDRRRDYVVFGKSFEYVCRPTQETNKAYFQFYREYIGIESQQYIPEGWLTVDMKRPNLPKNQLHIES